MTVPYVLTLPYAGRPYPAVRGPDGLRRRTARRHGARLCGCGRQHAPLVRGRQQRLHHQQRRRIAGG